MASITMLHERAGSPAGRAEQLADKLKHHARVVGRTGDGKTWEVYLEDASENALTRIGAWLDEIDADWTKAAYLTGEPFAFWFLAAPGQTEALRSSLRGLGFVVDEGGDADLLRIRAAEAATWEEFMGELDALRDLLHALNEAGVRVGLYGNTPPALTPEQFFALVSAQHVG